MSEEEKQQQEPAEEKTEIQPEIPPVDTDDGETPEPAILTAARTERLAMDKTLEAMKEERKKIEALMSQRELEGNAFAGMKQKTAEEKMQEEVDATVKNYLG